MTNKFSDTIIYNPYLVTKPLRVSTIYKLESIKKMTLEKQNDVAIIDWKQGPLKALELYKNPTLHRRQSITQNKLHCQS